MPGSPFHFNNLLTRTVKKTTTKINSEPHTCTHARMHAHTHTHSHAGQTSMHTRTVTYPPTAVHFNEWSLEHHVHRIISRNENQKSDIHSLFNTVYVLSPVVLSHLESGWHSCQCVEVFWPLVPQLLHHWKHVQHHTLPSLHTIIKPEEQIHVSHVILPFISYYIGVRASL